MRETVVCSLQIWVANDLHHRLVASKMASILHLGKKILGDEDLSVDVEYGSEIISQYTINEAKVDQGNIVITLQGKQTECLAPDKCGVKKCCNGSGCCS